jgi:hypothetical protein
VTASRDVARVPLLAIGLVGCTILLFQILLTRIFSVTMWYHFAFFAISLGLFGLAASGVAVTLATRRPERALHRMAGAAVALAIAIPVCFRLELALPFVPFDVAGAGAEAFSAYALFAAKFLLLAVPFFFAGAIIALAFTEFPDDVHQVYFADLVGGGIGCALVVPVLLVASGPGAVVATAAVPFLAAAVLYRAAGRQRAAVACTIAVYLVLGAVVAIESQGWLAVTRVKSYEARRAQEVERPKVYERWHPVSRVAVHAVEHSGTPWRWFYATGRSREFPPVMEVTNDGGARTYVYPAASRERLAELFADDTSDLVYALTEAPKVLVVGVGGGKDILSALAFDASSVTGVELNPLMIEVVQETFAAFSGAPYDDPRVHIAIDEGRNYVASRDEAYDVIKISVTDTWAASAVGAYAMTESYLYTAEATDAFLDHLEPDGYLSVTRWYPLETLRMVALASDALRRRGVVAPEQHLLMARNDATMTLLVRPTPVPNEHRERFRRRVEAAGLTLVTAPPGGSPAPMDLLHQRATVMPAEQLGRELAFDISPPRDDRPFFFNWSRLADARAGRYLETTGGFTLQHGRALNLLWGLLLITAGAAALFVLVPLVAARSVRLGAVPLPLRLGFNVYFLALGLGFMLVEIPLLQQLILFLGHPTYSLTVVLATLLVSSGTGSLAAQRFSIGERAARRFVFPGILVVLAAWIFLVPAALAAGIGLPVVARIALAVCAIAPVGFLLGMPFPIGLRQAHTVTPALVPWAWAVNGAASVTAPVLAMMVAIQRGFSSAYWLGLLAYAGAGLVLWGVSRRTGSPERPPLPAPLPQ